jgi:hypothetical protein
MANLGTGKARPHKENTIARANRETMNPSNTYHLVQETMEELLAEGLIRDQLNQETALPVPISAIENENSEEEAPRILVQVNFKVGRHKNKPCDEYMAKFTFK